MSTLRQKHSHLYASKTVEIRLQDNTPFEVPPRRNLILKVYTDTATPVLKFLVDPAKAWEGDRVLVENIPGTSEAPLSVVFGETNTVAGTVAAKTDETFRLVGGLWLLETPAGEGGEVDWANPGAIGTGTPNSGAFTTLSATGTATLPHIHGSIAGNLYVHVKNNSGGPLAKGTPVYAMGSVGNTDRVLVGPANNTSTSTMPALGLLETDLAVNADGNCIIVGELKDFNTSTYSINQELFVGGGGLSTTRPTTGEVQSVGVVSRVKQNTGIIVVNMQARISPNESFAAAVHNHTIAQITNLQTTLDGKEPAWIDATPILVNQEPFYLPASLLWNKSVLLNGLGGMGTATIVLPEIGTSGQDKYKRIAIELSNTIQNGTQYTRKQIIFKTWAPVQGTEATLVTIPAIDEIGSGTTLATKYHIFENSPRTQSEGQTWYHNTAQKVQNLIIPVAGTLTPQALGIANVGTSANFSREDHVHALPTPESISAEREVTKYTYTIPTTTTLFQIPPLLNKNSLVELIVERGTEDGLTIRLPITFPQKALLQTIIRHVDGAIPGPERTQIFLQYPQDDAGTSFSSYKSYDGPHFPFYVDHFVGKIANGLPWSAYFPGKVSELILPCGATSPGQSGPVGYWGIPSDLSTITAPNQNRREFEVGRPIRVLGAQLVQNVGGTLGIGQGPSVDPSNPFLSIHYNPGSFQQLYDLGITDPNYTVIHTVTLNPTATNLKNSGTIGIAFPNPTNSGVFDLLPGRRYTVRIKWPTFSSIAPTTVRNTLILYYIDPFESITGLLADGSQYANFLTTPKL